MFCIDMHMHMKAPIGNYGALHGYGYADGDEHDDGDTFDGKARKTRAAIHYCS